MNKEEGRRHRRTDTGVSSTSSSSRHDSVDSIEELSGTSSSFKRKLVGAAKRYESAFSPKDDGERWRWFGASSWVPDAMATKCYQCSAEFGFSGWKRTSRHHCRACGNCFCSKCSAKTIQLDANEKAVRVCDNCFAEISLWRRDSDVVENDVEASITPKSGNSRFDNTEWTEVSRDTVQSIPNEEIISELLPGETILRQFDKICFEYTHGQVYLTTYQLILRETAHKRKFPRAVVKIPMLSIERIEVSLNEEHEAGILDIFCKNFRFVRLAVLGMVQYQRFAEFHELEHELVNAAFPPASGLLYHERFTRVLAIPFANLEELDATSSACCMQVHHDDRREYERLFGDSDAWRISTSNVTFKLSNSYPRFLVVPSAVSDHALSRVADFRVRGRIPVASWRDMETGLIIARSSQPRVGILRSRSVADEELVCSLLISSKANGLVFLDARPVVNATVNKVTTSGGFEHVSHYNQTLQRFSRGCHVNARISIEFMDVQNKNSVLSSIGRVKKLIAHKLKRRPRFAITEPLKGHHGSPVLHNLLEASHEDEFEISWLQNFAESRWLEHLSYILRAAVRVVEIIKTENKSVVVHCSDGWDRTPQIVSLAMLFMDKHYRTIEGFISLVEKEWVSFGHPFRKRHGTGDTREVNASKGTIKHSRAHLSPIFLQFVECVWQVSKQFPTAFEFNENMLILLLDRVHDARHGNFIVNNRHEAHTHRLLGRSSCVWAEMLEHRQLFVNTAYAEFSEVLFPAFSTKVLQFWQGYFLRFDDSCVDREMGKRQVTLDSYSATKPSSLDMRRRSRVQRVNSVILVSQEADKLTMCRSIIDDILNQVVVQSLTNKVALLEAQLVALSAPSAATA